MNITFQQIWNFIETTHVTDDVLHLIDPKTGEKISTETYIKTTFWEKRFDIEKLKILWENCYSFIVLGSCITQDLRKFVEKIEIDNNVSAQAHIYMGKFGSRSFSIHADKPNNLIFQCIGRSRVTVYNESAKTFNTVPNQSDLTIKEQIILEPGSSIYIPSLQYHLFEPLTDRLSVSIPMYNKLIY